MKEFFIMLRFTQIRSIIRDWRVTRVLTLTLITFSVTYGLTNSWVNIVLATILGASLSFSGFLLDYSGKLYNRSQPKSNPAGKMTLSPRGGVIIAISILSVCIIVASLINPLIIIPIVSIVIIIILLSFTILDTPILKALSLGAFYAFSVLIGALSAYRYDIGVIFLTLFLFFAMTGAKALIETKNLPFDEYTNVKTIPKNYGLKSTGYFFLINQIIAYMFGIAVYATGLFNIVYFICIICIIIVGIPLNLTFMAVPTPKVANLVYTLSFGVLGILFTISMVVGKI